MQSYKRMIGRGVQLEHEVNRFLYDSRENPMQGHDLCNPKYGMGEIRDLLEPEYTRPNVDHRELDELGFTEWGRSQRQNA